jgi:DNA-binding transcriptional LysR family regulator
MKIFVKVAEVGSFAEAARALYLSPPAVTRAVASLESSIGSRLFVRTTRAVKITPAGSTYLDDCRRILAAVEASDFAARHAHTVPSGVLTVTAPAMFGQLYVLPVLLNYLLEQPNVSGRTMLTNRVTNLVDEDIDVAIRIGRLPDSTYRAIQVGSVRTLVCATPRVFSGERHATSTK